MRSFVLPCAIVILGISAYFLKFCTLSEKTTLLATTCLIEIPHRNRMKARMNGISGGQYNGTEKMTGKTVLITGANTGIGKETVKDLAQRGARIIMACRDENKCEAARKEIIRETGNENLVCSKMDLASFASIRAFAKEILKAESRIDVLINNAGIMMCPKDLTEDGHEMQMAVNHYGHFLLTNLLLDKIKASAPSRIIIVSSNFHRFGTMNFDDLNSEKSYSRFAAYGQSKLANLLHVLELSKRLEGTGVTVNGLHPGVVETELVRHIPFISSTIIHRLLTPFRYLFLKDSTQGAQTTLRLAVDPILEKVSGKYFSDCVEMQPYAGALIEADAKKLWEISEKVTQSTVV